MRPSLFASTLSIFSLVLNFSTAASFEPLEKSGIGYSFIHGISTDGSTIIGLRGGTGYMQGFRWDKSNGIQDLASPYGFAPVPAAVSADGSVIVGSIYTGGGHIAFRWTASTGIILLGTFGRDYSSATGVSADGTTVVGYSPGTSPGGTRAFKWTASTGMVALSYPYMKSSAATGISGDGSTILGWYTDDNSDNVSVIRWTGDGVDILPPPLDGVTLSATITNYDGTWIAGQGDTKGPPGYNTLLWESKLSSFSSPPANLGNLGPYGGLPPDGASMPAGISNDGKIVVGSSGIEAFIWTKETGLQSLKKVLSVAYGLDLKGWTLDAATGISADGQTIVGNGFDPQGINRGWVARGITHVPKLSYPTATPSPTPGIKPRLTFEGAPYRVSRLPKTELRGTAKHAQEVVYKVGNGKWKGTRGIRTWSFISKLKRGLNKISIRGIGQSPNTFSTKVVYIFFAPNR